MILKMKELVQIKPFLMMGAFSLGFFVLGYASFFLLDKISVENALKENRLERQKSTGYKFTSPLLDCSYDGGPFAIKSDNMKDKIEEVINGKIRNGKVKHVSAYFRDLNNGPTMEINAGEKFTPASLLKVPLMIAYLKKAETKPEILKEKIIYNVRQNGNDIGQNIKPDESLEIGKEYEVEELIKRMIIYSDNSAANLILGKMENDFLASVYTDLKIEIPGSQKTENYMTVKEYAAFFRILYNASYLNRTMSEKALAFLSESKYNDGLRAGVPSNVPLAHKFGERVFEDASQLHDCGIIYHDTSPYILCLMTRGNDFKDLASVIKDISKNVYEEVERE